MDPSERQYEDEIRFRAKRELRKRLRSVRAAMPASAVAQRSARIVERLLAHPAWAPAKTVALFVSMPDEVQLGAAIDAARAADKRVALPVVVDEPGLVFRAPFDDGEDHALAMSPFGVMEPGVDSPAVAHDTIDLVVVPAIAIDPRGYRIGYGAGYYDHTLPTLTRAVRIGVAFDFQLVAEVPERPQDVPVHWVITDARTEQATR